MRKLVVGGIIGALCLVTPAPAQACKCSIPSSWGFLVSDQAHMPSNAAGVPFVFDWGMGSRLRLPSFDDDDFQVEIRKGKRWKSVSHVVTPRRQDKTAPRPAWSRKWPGVFLLAYRASEGADEETLEKHHLNNEATYKRMMPFFI